MQAHTLKRKTKNKKSAPVGRGGTRGKTSGRGTKGQNARSGRKKRPELRDLIKKIPKMRGRGKSSNLSIQIKPTVVSLDQISKNFSNGSKVTPATIVAKGILKAYKGKNQQVKIVSDGEISIKVIVVGCAVGLKAKAKIEKAGGEVK
ncbi:MAG: uL15 family ribosomal protein [bacterium]